MTPFYVYRYSKPSAYIPQSYLVFRRRTQRKTDRELARVEREYLVHLKYVKSFISE